MIFQGKIIDEYIHNSDPFYTRILAVREMFAVDSSCRCRKLTVWRILRSHVSLSRWCLQLGSWCLPTARREKLDALWMGTRWFDLGWHQRFRWSTQRDKRKLLLDNKMRLWQVWKLNGDPKNPQRVLYALSCVGFMLKNAERLRLSSESCPASQSNHCEDFFSCDFPKKFWISNVL